MTHIAEKLDKKLATWSPQVAAQVEQLIANVIELADADALDLLPAQHVVHEVLDTRDARYTRRHLLLRARTRTSDCLSPRRWTVVFPRQSRLRGVDTWSPLLKEGHVQSSAMCICCCRRARCP